MISREIKYLLRKVTYILAILLGLEIVSGLSSHLVMFLTSPHMVTDGQYQLTVCQFAAYALWGGIVILFLIVYFDKKIKAFAKTTLVILALYCVALLTFVIVVERVMLGKSHVVEHVLFIVLNFLYSPITAILAVFQVATLLIPIVTLVPFVFVLSMYFLYLKAKNRLQFRQ